MHNYVRIVVQLPVAMKEAIDSLRTQGYTASGFIRAAIARELAIRKGDKMHLLPQPHDQRGPQAR